MVRLGPVVDSILSAHSYPPAIKLVLAEALVLTSLLGGLLKRKGDQLTLQAQASGGAISLLVCDYRGGELRGYVKQAAALPQSIGVDSSLSSLFGTGYLAITFDIDGTEQRYQGIVPLEGATLSEAVESYFLSSEQIPTIVRTSIQADVRGCIAGGILVQHLAQGEEGRERLHLRVDHPQWGHVSAITSSIRQDELVDPATSLEALTWRLYNQEPEVRTDQVHQLTRGCRCSEAHFEEVLARFPSGDRKDMRDERGIIVVDCAFCSKEFAIQD